MDSSDDTTLAFDGATPAERSEGASRRGEAADGDSLDVATTAMREDSMDGDTIMAPAFDRTAEPPGPQAALPRPGTHFGRYEIRSRLGAGGMGVVLSAHDSELERDVALKFVLGRDTREETTERLRREAQALAQLSHPNVVAVHDVGRHGDTLYVAMELVPGVTLGEWLSAEPRNWREVVDVFRQAGEGLAAAHEADLVHRDFKPDNVMVDDHPGRSIAAEVLDGPSSVLSGALTRTGALMGTPVYMSPEQLRGDELGGHTDQWSFCVALYEALMGRRPFDQSTLPELVRAIVSDDPPSMRGSGVPRKVVDTIERGLHKDPNGRWPSMRALLDALAAATDRRTRIGIGTIVIATISAAGAAALTRADGPAPVDCDRVSPHRPIRQRLGDEPSRPVHREGPRRGRGGPGAGRDVSRRAAQNTRGVRRHAGASRPRARQ
jgi:hypothetical protein